MSKRVIGQAGEFTDRVVGEGGEVRMGDLFFGGAALLAAAAFDFAA